MTTERDRLHASSADGKVASGSRTLTNGWKTVTAARLTEREWRIDSAWTTVANEKLTSSVVVTSHEASSSYAWYRAEGYRFASST